MDDLVRRLFALNLHAVRLHWLAQRATNAGHPAFAQLLLGVCRVITGADFQYGAKIGYGLTIVHSSGIAIGGDVTIGEFCTLYQQVAVGSNGKSYEQPRIGSHVTICAGAKVLGGVTVGDGAVIGANSVVLSDVRAGSTVVGVPAREIRPRLTGKLQA